MKVLCLGLSALGICTLVYGIMFRRKEKIDGTAILASSSQLKAFYITDGVQWFVIILLIVILGRIGKGTYIPYGIMIAVGLHFIPMAQIFKDYLYILTGLVVTGIGIVAIIVANLQGEPSMWPFVATASTLALTNLILIALMVHYSQKKL